MGVGMGSGDEICSRAPWAGQQKGTKYEYLGAKEQTGKSSNAQISIDPPNCLTLVVEILLHLSFKTPN